MVGSLSSDSDNQSNYSTIRSLDGIANTASATTTTATSTTAQPKDEVDCLINNNCGGGGNISSSTSSKTCTKFPVFISSSKSPPTTTTNNNNHTDPPENFVRVRNSSLQMETADVDVCFDFLFFEIFLDFLRGWRGGVLL